MSWIYKELLINVGWVCIEYMNMTLMKFAAV